MPPELMPVLHCVHTGAFVTGLEYATGANATVIGKPERAFFHEALKLVDIAPERTVMIGDVCNLQNVY